MSLEHLPVGWVLRSIVTLALVVLGDALCASMGMFGWVTAGIAAGILVVPSRSAAGGVLGALAAIATLKGAFGTYPLAFVVFLVAILAIVIARWSYFFANSIDPSPLALRVARRLVAGVVVVAIQIDDLESAGANCERVIVAVHQYRSREGKYPETLDNLVPFDLDEVPKARRWTITTSEFDYLRFDDEDGALISWVDLPPFSRRTYTFGDRRHGYVE